MYSYDEGREEKLLPDSHICWLLKKIGKTLVFEDKESQWSLIGLNLSPQYFTIRAYFSILFPSSFSQNLVQFSPPIVFQSA
jgi:hypothetical protein